MSRGRPTSLADRHVPVPTARGLRIDSPRTVVLSMQGGLGNQLFQWAFATSLRAGGVRVVVDRVRCRGERPFAIAPLVSGWPQLARPLGLGLAAAHRTGLLGRRPFPPLVQETSLAHDPELAMTARRGGYLLGYFQSATYFADATDEVTTRARAFLDGLLTERGRVLADELATDDAAVAVHVRRGDYVSDPATAAHHGALGSDYYDAAFAGLGARSGRRVWFSDDRQWVRRHLARDGDLVCPDGMTVASAGEIALMASCRSRVIANSSFSWWAGYLGRQPGEQDGAVVAPRRWLRDGVTTPPSLLPAGWSTA